MDDHHKIMQIEEELDHNHIIMEGQDDREFNGNLHHLHHQIHHRQYIGDSNYYNQEDGMIGEDPCDDNLNNDIRLVGG
jgi:hypothetical protein